MCVCIGLKGEEEEEEGEEEEEEEEDKKKKQRNKDTAGTKTCSKHQQSKACFKLTLALLVSD